MIAVTFAQLEAMVRDSPYHEWLGVRLAALDPDKVTIEMPWRAEFVSSRRGGYAHGGVLASLIDLAADYAVAAQLGHGLPTVDLRVDYHRPAMPGTLRAEGRVVKLGRTVATADATILDAAGKLIASGRGVFLVQGEAAP